MKSSSKALWRSAALRGAVAFTIVAWVNLQPLVSIQAASLTSTNVWTGYDDYFSYNDPDNWSLGVTPNSASAAVLFGGPDMGTGSFWTIMSGNTAMGKLMFTNSLDVTSVLLQANNPTTDLIQLYGTGGVGIYQSFPRAVSIQPKIQVMADQTWQINSGSLDLLNQLDISTHALTFSGSGIVNARAAVKGSAGPITLNGNSVLNLWSDNSTTLTGGSLVVNAGRLGLGHNNAAGNSGIQLNGPTAVLAPINGYRITNSSAISGTQGAVDVSATSFLRLNGAISTTQVTKTGAGTLLLGTPGVNTFQRLTISQGMVQVSGGTLPTSSEVVLNGGKLDIGRFVEHVNKLTLLADSTVSLTANAPASSLTIDELELESGVWTIEGWDGTAGQPGVGTHIYVGEAEGESVTTGVYFAGLGVGGKLIDSTTPGFKELVPVPEPGMLTLLAGLGGLGLLWGRANRKS